MQGNEGRKRRRKDGEKGSQRDFLGGIWLLQLTTYVEVLCSGRLCLDATIVAASSSLTPLFNFSGCNLAQTT